MSIYRKTLHAADRVRSHKKQKQARHYEDRKPKKHAVVTSLQMRILLFMENHRLSTYQIAKQLKVDFWKVQEALKSMFWRGFTTCDNKLWRNM